MSTSDSSVSVIIPTFNQAQYLAEAVESALNQTRPPHEVIVVDDGSTDDTPDVLSRYSSRIRAIHKPNAGVAEARNTGMEAATGDLYAFLDSDDRWLPAKLERQVSLMESDLEIGFVHCGVRYIGSGGEVLQERTDGASGRIAHEMLLHRGTTVLGPGSSALMRKSAVKAVGGRFDPRCPPSEDWDMCLRIATIARAGFVPEVLVEYRMHDNNSHRDINRMERGMMVAFEKAFTEPDPERRRIRRPAYANLHMVLAGSYLHAGEPRAAVRHGIRSVSLRPANLAYLLRYPQRVWRRHRS